MGENNNGSDSDDVDEKLDELQPKRMTAQEDVKSNDQRLKENNRDVQEIQAIAEKTAFEDRLKEKLLGDKNEVNDSTDKTSGNTNTANNSLAEEGGGDKDHEYSGGWSRTTGSTPSPASELQLFNERIELKMKLNSASTDATIDQAKRKQQMQSLQETMARIRQKKKTPATQNDGQILPESFHDRVQRKIQEGSYAQQSSTTPAAMASRSNMHRNTAVAKSKVEELHESKPPTPFVTEATTEVSALHGGKRGQKQKVILEEVLDDNGPILPPHMMAEASSTKSKQKHVEQLEDDSGPMFLPQQMDEGAKSKQAYAEKLENVSPRMDRTEVDLEFTAVGDKPPVIPRDIGRPGSNRADPALPPSEPESTNDPSQPTFYAVEARLVEYSSSSDNEEADEAPAPIYAAQIIPDQASLPWYKRKKTKAGGVLLVAIAIALTIGAVAGWKGNENDEDMASLIQVIVTANPTTSPTFLQATTNCTPSKPKPFYEIECEDAIYEAAFDGNTAVLTRDEECSSTDDDDDEESQRLHIISDIANLGSNNSSFYDTRSYVGTLAVSGDTILYGNEWEVINDAYTGAVYIIEKDSSRFSNETRISPVELEDGARFASSIDIDGNVIVVGAPYDRGTNGTAYIFRRIETEWAQEARIGSEDPNTENFGDTVIVQGDTIFVADNLYGSNETKIGAVLVYQYERPSNVWQLTETITNAGCESRFGSSLATTPDESLVIGCREDQSNAGTLYFYMKSDEGIYVQQQKIGPPDDIKPEKFGRKLSISGDLMAVGNGDKLEGKVYVYILDGTDNLWKKVTEISPPTADHTYWGTHIRLSGRNLLVSYWGNTYIYELVCAG